MAAVAFLCDASMQVVKEYERHVHPSSTWILMSKDTTDAMNGLMDYLKRSHEMVRKELGRMKTSNNEVTKRSPTEDKT